MVDDKSERSINIPNADKKISRRKFLKIAGLGAAATVAGVKTCETTSSLVDKAKQMVDFTNARAYPKEDDLSVSLVSVDDLLPTSRYDVASDVLDVSASDQRLAKASGRSLLSDTSFYTYGVDILFHEGKDKINQNHDASYFEIRIPRGLSEELIHDVQRRRSSDNEFEPDKIALFYLLKSYQLVLTAEDGEQTTMDCVLPTYEKTHLEGGYISYFVTSGLGFYKKDANNLLKPKLPILKDELKNVAIRVSLQDGTQTDFSIAEAVKTDDIKRPPYLSGRGWEIYYGITPELFTPDQKRAFDIGVSRIAAKVTSNGEGFRNSKPGQKGTFDSGVYGPKDRLKGHYDFNHINILKSRTKGDVLEISLSNEIRDVATKDINLILTDKSGRNYSARFVVPEELKFNRGYDFKTPNFYAFYVALRDSKIDPSSQAMNVVKTPFSLGDIQRIAININGEWRVDEDYRTWSVDRGYRTPESFTLGESGNVKVNFLLEDIHEPARNENANYN